MGDMRACDSPTSNSPELSTMSSMNSRRIVESAGSASPTSGTTLGTITLAAGGLSTSNAKSSSSEQQRQQHPDGSEVDGKEYEMDTDQPGAKRRRVEQEQQISSCETCKHRKVKCDRTQPSCLRCQRSRQDCVYKQKKKPGLRAGIGRELEERLDRVESMLASHARILEGQFKPQQLPSPSNPSTGSHVSSPTSPLLGATYHNQTSHNDSPTVGPGGRYQYSQRNGGAVHLHSSEFTGSPSTSVPDLHNGIRSHSFRDRTDSTASHMDVDQSSTSAGLPVTSSGISPPMSSKTIHSNPSLNSIGNPSSSSPRTFDPELPPDDILYQIIDLFFSHVQPSCPILHRQTLLDSYFARPLSDIEPADIILLFAIVAASLRFSTDPRLSEEWKRHFRALAKQKVISNALENPSVQSLRAMIIIVLDVVGTTNGPSGWGLLALTTRMAVHLGLNTEPSNSPGYLTPGGNAGEKTMVPSISTWGVGVLPEPKDWIEQEGRRRLFWMVYVLDIYTSLGTSLDLTLDENEIERLLPCQDELWDRNQFVLTRWFRTSASTPTNSGTNSTGTGTANTAGARKKSVSGPNATMASVDPGPNASGSTPGSIGVNNVGNLSSFSFLVEILGLLGRIHRFLRKTIDINNLADVEVWQLKYRTLDKALTSWKYSLPMQYGNLTRALNMGIVGNAVDPGWVLLHAAYNTAVIRLHSVAAYPTNRSSIFGPSYSAGQRCLSATENIAALTRIVMENNMLSHLGSTFAFTLWVAARLLMVHASTTEYPMIPDVRLFLDALHEMGRIYETAERYANILQRVIDELTSASNGNTSSGDNEDRALNDSEAGANDNGAEERGDRNKMESEDGDADNSATTPRASEEPGANKKTLCLAILADMRRTAYAVDVLISRQPNMKKIKSAVASYADSECNGPSLADNHTFGAFTSINGNGNGFGASRPLPAYPQPLHHNHTHMAQHDNRHQHHVPTHHQMQSSPSQQLHMVSGLPVDGSPTLSNLNLGVNLNLNQQQLMMMNNPQTFEYLDVFNWFNFPRVPFGTGMILGDVSAGQPGTMPAGPGGPGGDGFGGSELGPEVSEVPSQATDWLFQE